MNTVVFDMDGLLIDSEPLWEEAAREVFQTFGVTHTSKNHTVTTGLRTPEYLEYWFRHYNLDATKINFATEEINKSVIEKVRSGRATIMSGVDYIFNFFIQRKFKIGLASSSPMGLINCVVDIINIRPYLQAMTSAENLAFGKPHPQVYLDCVKMLHSNPAECVCFEDSFNGMIAVKAARMKCVVVPVHTQYKEERWSAADLKLNSLKNFGEIHLKTL